MGQDIEFKSLEELYLAYHVSIRNYLYYLGGDLNIAEDLTQETFYRAGRSLMFKGNIGYVSAWLHTIARNQYINMIKKNKINSVSLCGLPEKTIPAESNNSFIPDEALLSKERQNIIITSLLKLNENQRTVLILREYQGLSYIEISQIMELSPMAIKSLLNRARLNFRKLYFEYMEKE